MQYLIYNNGDRQRYCGGITFMPVQYVSMKRGVAFIRGICMYGTKNYTRRQMLWCLNDIENEDIAIVGIDGADNVVFETNGHYAAVGQCIE